MSQGSAFWGIVRFLMDNPSAFGAMTHEERDLLKDAIADASATNVLTGIPSECVEFVRALSDIVNERLQKKMHVMRRTYSGRLS